MGKVTIVVIILVCALGFYLLYPGISPLYTEMTTVSVSYTLLPQTGSALKNCTFNIKTKAYATKIFMLTTQISEVIKKKATNEFQKINFTTDLISLNITLKIVNATGYVILKRTFSFNDGFNRDIIFIRPTNELKPCTYFNLTLTIDFMVDYSYLGAPFTFERHFSLTRRLHIATSADKATETIMTG